MSSLVKLRFCALAFIATFIALTLTACGFTPLYATTDHEGGQGSVSGSFDTVALGNIPDQSGQYLRNALIDRLYRNGRPSQPLYTLNFTPIHESESGLDITKSATTTRDQIRLNTTMALIDTQTGKAVLTRKLLAINSFNVLQSQYDTRVSEQAVRENALDDLARQVEAQLALFFKRGAVPDEVPDTVPLPALKPTATP